MTDEEREYREAMTWLERQLGTIHDQVQLVAERLGNGAMLSYPAEHRNPELFELHQKLTLRTDEIIDRMQSLHKAFNQSR